MKKTALLLIFLPALFLFSCGQKQEVPEGQPNISRVFVDSVGIIFLDGKTITLSDLDEKLKDMEAKKNMIYYSTNNSLQHPPKEAKEAMETIVKHVLPIKIFPAKTLTESMLFK